VISLKTIVRPMARPLSSVAWVVSASTTRSLLGNPNETDRGWSNSSTSTVEVVSPDGYSAFAIGASESSEPEQPTATPTPVETDTPVETATAADTPAGTATPTPGADTSEQTPESTATQTPAPTPTPGAGGPGFGVVAALLAFVATLAALWRR
jgi:cobalamin biosynthesis Mg chelatase CobN